MKKELIALAKMPAEPAGQLAKPHLKMKDENTWELWIGDEYVFDAVREEDGLVYIHAETEDGPVRALLQDLYDGILKFCDGLQ